MSVSTNDPWFAADARARVAEVVGRVESRTGAELVVTVRAASDHYRDADLISGVLLALAVLLVYLYLPLTFSDALAGPAVVLAFSLGFAISTRLTGLRRVLLARARLHAAVRAAAREAFVDQSISTTRGRAGILVFVSLLERRVEIVADIGITNAPLPDSWTAAVQSLERSLERDPSPAGFEQALAALAAPLAHALPRQTDDVNELPDEVRP